MDFRFDETQTALRDLAREFAEKELAPIAADIDKNEAIPKRILEQMAEMGLFGLNVPEEYGGVGADAVSKVLVISELARKCASTAEVLSVHTLGTAIIKDNGTEEQKKKYLGMAARGAIAAFALTEPGAGSDAAAVKTKAVRDGDDYIINGTKCFISNMGPTEGDFVVVIALTQPELATKGMSAFIVERNTPGFSIGKREEKMGMRGADISEINFVDCRVSKDNLLGKEGDGFKIAMKGLDGGRIGMAAQALGICDECIKQSVKYSGERVQFGKPVGANQGLQWYMADMATRTEAAWALTLEAASKQDQGLPFTKEASMAKYFASEVSVWVTSKALQIHGGYGYMRDYPIERMYRDARLIPIYEGTSEVQKMVIARAVMR